MPLEVLASEKLDTSLSAFTNAPQAFEALSNAPRRAELSRQRPFVAFEHETIELCPAFRTTPEPIVLLSPRHDASVSSILRHRSASTSLLTSEEVPSAVSFKKKKKVSFLQKAPRNELETSVKKPCECQGVKRTDTIKTMPSPIHAICRRAERQALKHLLSFYVGADLLKLVNSICACGRSPLEVACEGGDLYIVKMLLKRHADPNSGSFTSRPRLPLSSHCRNDTRRTIDATYARTRQLTCLGIVIKNRKLDLLELLLHYGARIDEDAFIMAATLGYADVIHIVVKFATADAKKRASPMHHFFHKNGPEVIESASVPLLSSILLQKACSAAAGKHSELISVLLGDGKTSVSKQKVICCAFEAVGLRDTCLLKCLLKLYRTSLLLDARESVSQSSLLHVAIKNGTVKMVLLLIENGADVHAKDGSGIPPLYLACARGQDVVVEALLKKGATCMAVGPSGETPLHIAAQENQLACIKVLLDAGHVHVDQVTHDRCTALHLASQRGNTAVAACLLDFGADIHALTKENESPLLKASRMSQFQTVKLLVSRNASSKPFQTRHKLEEKSVVAKKKTSFASSMGTAVDIEMQLPRSRSWSSSGNDSQRKSGKNSSDRICIVKSNTHTSLKHWLRSVLHN